MKTFIRNMVVLCTNYCAGMHACGMRDVSVPECYNDYFSGRLFDAEGGRGWQGAAVLHQPAG